MLRRAADDPAYAAFLMLRVGFTVLPIVMGLDKFTNLLTNWEGIPPPWIVDVSPLSAHGTMLVVGVIEIIAGVAVAIKPRYAAYVVTIWLLGIIVNLLTYSGFFHVALRGFGLLPGALRYCQDLWMRLFQATSVSVDSPVSVGVMSTGRSSSLPLWKTAPARTRATRCGALTARQRACAASISL